MDIEKLKELITPESVTSLTDFDIKKLVIAINDGLEATTYSHQAQIDQLTVYKEMLIEEQEYRLQPYITTKTGFKPIIKEEKPKKPKKSQ